MSYLDHLTAQYDEVRTGIDVLVNRAVEDKRDVTDAEQKQIDRDTERLSQLQTGIEHYGRLEQGAAKVAELRRSVKATGPAAIEVKAGETPEAYDIAREFPTPGDYAITLHRAMVRKDPEAVAMLDRATAHQVLADNPGIIPKVVLGPLLNLLDASRPFVNSITRRPLPAGKFDRPRVTQHVAVGVQAAEKTLTESQKMLIDSISVTAKTYAGHLNISRQDIKWSSPSILNLVLEDFAAVYAVTTNAAAVADFVASITGATIPATARSGVALTTALYKAAAQALDTTSGPATVPDTLWLSPDMWGLMGSMHTSQDVPAFPQLSLGSTSGNPLGLRMVVDRNFPDGTIVTGPARFAEFYEDVDGLMQVGEPDVLGQLVGYAGYAAFLNVQPLAFRKITVPAEV